MENKFEDKIVLITGGTGTFGHIFTKILLEEYNPHRIRIFSRSELLQVQMEKEFNSHPNLRFMIGDIQDEKRLASIMSDVDIVIHAAAMKQVPVAEYNPEEAVKINVLGTMNVIRSAVAKDVERVFLLSSDKAVHPNNLYGGTKFIAEKMFVQGNLMGRIPNVKDRHTEKTRNTLLSSSRFGNVVGSRGSVILLFIKQKNEGLIQITDKRMTRFWMEQDIAARFVIDCINEMEGGEIFIPKIPSARILDIAKLIAPETPIKEMGIRPGEKLHELLISKEESTHAIERETSFVIEPELSFFEKEKRGKYKSVPYEYSSDSPECLLGKEDLKKIINNYLNLP